MSTENTQTNEVAFPWQSECPRVSNYCDKNLRGYSIGSPWHGVIAFVFELERELAEKTNEVARLQAETDRLYIVAQEASESAQRKTNEVARLRELLNRALECLKVYGGCLGSEAAKQISEELAPAPEETLSECKCDYTSIIRATHNGKTYDQCSKCGKKFRESFEKEPAPEWRELGEDEVIQEGDEEWHPKRDSWIACGSFGSKPSDYDPIFRFRTRRPLPVAVNLEQTNPAVVQKTEDMSNNEWRDLGPDEVICEVDDYQNEDGLWFIVGQWAIGRKASFFNLRFRTRRPLPKPKDEPAPDHLHHWMRLQESINRDIAGELQALRDEIQKLKEAK